MFKTLRKYLGVSVYVFIITLLFFGCMNLKTHVNLNHTKSKTESFKHVKVDKKFKKGAENFVYLVKEVSPLLPEMCDHMPGPCEPMVASSASGLVLSSDNSSIFVLTAAHFCSSLGEDINLFHETIYGLAADQQRILFPLRIDIENDICLLMGPKIKGEHFNNIEVASKFTVGEKIYTVAAPLGIGGSGIRLIFQGNLGGCDARGCLSTIPATFGSSGGGIYNKKGQLITIVMAVPETFDNVTISPSNTALINFIRDIDSEVDIYPY